MILKYLKSIDSLIGDQIYVFNSESKVKEEPLEKSDSNVVKKIKLESEPSVQSATSKVSEKPAPAKPHAKQATGKNAPSKPANQSTLTSFFKKA